MRKELLAILIILSIGFGCITILPVKVYADLNMDIHCFDTIGDVELVTSEGEYLAAGGHPDIDISYARSYKEEGLKENIVLELTVQGEIIDSDDVKYLFLVAADGVDYLVMYTNKKCTVTKMDTAASSIADYEKKDSTLEIKILPLKLGNPQSSFEWSAAGLETEADKRYVDLAPNKLVKITKPSNGATVYGNISVQGVVGESTRNIQVVEVKIDDGAWEGASTSNGWATWSYEWNTLGVTNSLHHIYARCYDGVEYFEDSITVYVDQTTASNPRRLESLPTILVGDLYDYVASGDPEVVCINVAMVSDMESEVKASESLEVEGANYDVLRYEVHQVGEMLIGGFTVTNTVDRISWLRSSDRALVKEDTTTVISGDLVETTTIHTIKTYNPPLAKYDFPIAVGETWSSTVTVKTESTTTTGGETTSSSSIEAITINYECLCVEDIAVAAGNYETFAVRAQRAESRSYKVEYYTTQHCFPVMMKTHDSDERLIAGLGLKEYTKGGGFRIVILDILQEPAELKAGEEVKLTVEAKNVGTLDASDAYVKVLEGNVILDEKHFPLSAGTNKSIELNFILQTSGNHTLTIATNHDIQTKNIFVAKSTVPSSEGKNIQIVIIAVTCAIVAVLLSVVLVVRKLKKR